MYTPLSSLAAAGAAGWPLSARGTLCAGRMAGVGGNRWPALETAYREKVALDTFAQEAVLQDTSAREVSAVLETVVQDTVGWLLHRVEHHPAAAAVQL